MQQQSDMYQYAMSYNNNGIRYMKMKEYEESNRCFRIALRYVRSFVESDDREYPITDGNMKEIRSLHMLGTDDLSQYADVMSSDAMIITTDSATHGNIFECGIDTSSYRPIFMELPTIDPDSLPSVCHTVNTTDMERLLSIVLYNMGLCCIHALRVRCYTDGKNHTSELLPLKAMKVLMSSHQLTQTMISKIDHINASTVQTWYGIHQLEFRVLSALMCLYYSNDDRLVVIRIEERIRRIQQVLHAHDGMVHFLRSLASVTIAPCA